MPSPAPIPLKFDEVGIWSEIKLEIIEKYGTAYTKAFTNQPNLKKYYIDAFSGAGAHVSKSTGRQIEGSPARALKVQPPFDGFYFIDMNQQKTAHLEQLCQGRSDVQIKTGDASHHLTSDILPRIQFANYNRALCLFDPYGLHLEWPAIQMAGHSKAIDMLLNFPVMDMNRNAIWRTPSGVPQEGIDRMNRFWGDASWRAAAYARQRQGDLFGTPIEKQSNEAIVTAFRSRLRDNANFKYVPEPLAMKNKNNAVVYYLFFAAQKPVANKIIEGIFDRYR